MNQKGLQESLEGYIKLQLRDLSFHDVLLQGFNHKNTKHKLQEKFSTFSFHSFLSFLSLLGFTSENCGQKDPL